jgi:transposase
MGLSRRTYTKEFKLAAVKRMEQGVSIGEVARALEVNPNVLHRWRREFRQGPGNAFPGNGKQRWSEGRIAELERKVGQQTLEIDFLKGCLQRIEEQRMLQALNGKARVNIDYHIEVERHFYSVPYALVHQQVDVHVTGDAIEVLHHGVRVAFLVLSPSINFSQTVSVRGSPRWNSS